MENGNFYIGNRRRSGKRRVAHRLLAIAATMCALLIFLNAQLYPQITALAENAVSRRLTEIVGGAVAELLEKEGDEYRDMLTVSYAEGGRIAALTEDTLRMQRLRYRLAQLVLHALTEQEVAVDIPVGNLFGLLFLSGRGNALSVSVQAPQSLIAGYDTDFVECGINQTLYTVDIRLEITVYYLLPVRSRKMTYVNSFRAAEAIIVGEVPDNLTQINRYTDETEEIEIDDAVDFGGILD